MERYYRKITLPSLVESELKENAHLCVGTNITTGVFNGGKKSKYGVKRVGRKPGERKGF